jgi:hypothetical protein
MIFSENRFALFRVMRWRGQSRADAVWPARITSRDID